MKVAEADIVVVTVRPQRMSRDDALISSGWRARLDCDLFIYFNPKNESFVKKLLHRADSSSSQPRNGSSFSRGERSTAW